MPSPLPSDLIWKPLAPLLEQFESLQAVMDICTLYLPWCAGGAVGLAALVLTGVVLINREPAAPRSVRTNLRKMVPT